MLWTVFSFGVYADNKQLEQCNEDTVSFSIAYVIFLGITTLLIHIDNFLNIFNIFNISFKNKDSFVKKEFSNLDRINKTLNDLPTNLKNNINTILISYNMNYNLISNSYVNDIVKCMEIYQENTKNMNNINKEFLESLNIQ